MKDTPIDICYTSDLSRASQTAEIVTEAHPGKPMILDTRLKEEVSNPVIDSLHALRLKIRQFLGELQGKVYNPPFPAEWLATVEPREDLIKRLTDFYDGLFRRARLANRPSFLKAGQVLLS
jgi:broad specificity phosphatase PhoE